MWNKIDNETFFILFQSKKNILINKVAHSEELILQSVIVVWLDTLLPALM